MALLKGKYVQGSSLDGSKIKLKNGEALKGTNTDGSDKEILKVNGQNKTEFPEVPMVLQDPVADGDLARKAYVDAQRQAAIAHAESLHLGQETAIANEVAARQAGDSALSERVTTLETSTSDKDYVDQKVLEEKQLREAADEALDARLDAIESDPVTKAYVDAGDQASKDYADQKIADLVNSAPETLDTLKELADAIAAGETASQGLLTLIGQTDDKVDAEVLNRQSADQVLDDKIDQEVADRQAGDSALDARLDALEAVPSPVVDSMDGSQTDKAPSVASTKAYIEAVRDFRAVSEYYVDGANGVDAAGRGSFLKPYKTISYAYSQVSSAATDLTKWCSEKLVLKIAPGTYAENVVIGFKRARVAVIGEGVFINGSMTVKMLKEDQPTVTAAGLPAPWTGDNARATLDLVGMSGGMEAGYTSCNLMINGEVRVLSEAWANSSSWQFGGALSHYVCTKNVQLRGGLVSAHDPKTFTGSIGPNITCEVDSSSIEGGYFGAVPPSPGAPMLSAANHVFNIKAHNSQLKSTIGPRAAILEIDSCRVMNMDRTMGGAVSGAQDASGITFQNSSSFSGIVNSPFAGSIYRIGRTSTTGTVTPKMDANSYLSFRLKTIDSGVSTVVYALSDAAAGVSVGSPATNYTRATNDVDAALAGIDAALGTKAGQTDLNTEIVNRQAGDTAEAAARQAADTAEATARQAGDAALGARLQPLESDPVTKTYVDGQMADEVSARQAADGALSGRLSVLEADPTTKSYVDSEVAGAKTYTDGKIGDLINGAPAMLDTLKEIADAIGAGSDVATGLANSISQEVSDRQAADLVLDGKITAEQTRATSEEGRIEGKLDQEIADRTIAVSNAIQGAQSRLIREIQNRAVSEQVIIDSVTAEVSRAQGEEARIEGKVDAETSARQQAIIAEATARDAAISVAVMAEQFARELFDTSFDQRLNQEVLDRQAAMVAEQVARDAAVAGLASAVGEELTFVASNLAQETSARQAADVAIDARLDSIEAAPHIEGRKELKTLGAGDLAYVDMAAMALDNTMMVIVGGLVHHEGESYALSAQGGVTRLTWAGDLASGGLNPLAAGDKVYCQYLANALTGGGGGGGLTIVSVNLQPSFMPGMFSTEITTSEIADTYEIEQSFDDGVSWTPEFLHDNQTYGNNPFQPMGFQIQKSSQIQKYRFRVTAGAETSEWFELDVPAWDIQVNSSAVSYSGSNASVTLSFSGQDFDNQHTNFSLFNSVSGSGTGMIIGSNMPDGAGGNDPSFTGLYLTQSGYIYGTNPLILTIDRDYSDFENKHVIYNFVLSSGNVSDYFLVSGTTADPLSISITQPVLPNDNRVYYTGSLPVGATVWLLKSGTDEVLQARTVPSDPAEQWVGMGPSLNPGESVYLKVTAVQPLAGSEVYVTSDSVVVASEIVVSGAPEINTTDMSDPQIASGKAKVTWSFSGTAVAIEGRNWDEASGQYAESISTTNLPSPVEGTLVRYANRTVLPQKLLRRLVGVDGGRSEWFELIIQGTGGSVE
jgi:hypothetical protein